MPQKSNGLSACLKSSQSEINPHQSAIVVCFFVLFFWLLFLNIISSADITFNKDVLSVLLNKFL